MIPILFRQLLVPIVTASLLCSCGEDAELVRKHGAQEAEVAKLRGELALLEERLKNIPEDHSAQLKEAQEKQVKLEAELEGLNNEIGALEEKRKKLLEDYANYQQRYVVR